MFGIGFGFEISKEFLELHTKLAKVTRENATIRLEKSAIAVELESTKLRLRQMIQERDDIQLRLHAIDHAYSEQQTKENTLLRDTLQRNAEAMETIRRQREFIRTLYTLRKARKAKGSTSAQSERESGPKVKSGGNAAIICSHEGLHKHYQGPCPHCGAGTLG